MILDGVVFCRLTGKRLIIQKVFFKENENPMLVNPEKEIQKYLVRYWSKPQDKFFSHMIYPEEISLTKPKFDYDSHKQ